MKNRISNLMFINIVVIASLTTGCVSFQEMAYDARIKQFERNVQKSVESDFDLDFYNKKPLEEKIDWLKFASEECLDKGDMDAVAVVRRAGSRLYNETSEKEFLEIIPRDSKTTVQGLFFILAQGKDYRYGYESSYLWMEDAEALDVLNKYTESAVALIKDWNIPDNDIKYFLCYAGGKEIKAVSNLRIASSFLETYTPVLAEAYDNSAKIILRYAYMRDYLHGYYYNDKYEYWGENYYSYSSANEIVSDCLSDPGMLSEALESAQNAGNEEKVAMIRELMGENGSIAVYQEEAALTALKEFAAFTNSCRIPETSNLSFANLESVLDTVDAINKSLFDYSRRIPEEYILRIPEAAKALSILSRNVSVAYSGIFLFLNNNRSGDSYENGILKIMYDITFSAEESSHRAAQYSRLIGDNEIADFYERFSDDMEQKREKIIELYPGVVHAHRLGK